MTHVERLGALVRYLDFLAALAVASQVQLGCLPRGIWGTKTLWGRVVTHPGDQP